MPDPGPRDRSRDPQPAPGDATQSRRTDQQTAGDALAKARDDLRVSRKTEKRIASECEALKKSGDASAEDLRNCEAYLDNVRGMVAENRAIVEQMEAVQTRYVHAAPGSRTGDEGELQTLFDPDIAEEQTIDEITRLDRELNSSLARFDDMLLKEMVGIRTRSAQKMQDLAEEAAAAAKRLRERGINPETTPGETLETSPTKNAGEEKRTEAEKDSAPGVQRPDPSTIEDDDIVARQLREAAENETDPKLKEKLWQEYEAYKKNTKRLP